MSKFCARCSKAVYTIEELKCLDKIWHKGCFKCETCGMTLNMRNYKGFDKHPYCEAHVPKVKPTTMAETPELRRIAENTKIQSNVKYHEDFEKSKGKFTQVVDDPEIKRIQQNSKIISNVAYHGDLEKKAAMEQKRNHNDNFNSTNNFDQNYSFQNNIPDTDNSNRNDTMQRVYLPPPPPQPPSQAVTAGHSLENAEINSNAQNNNINMQLIYQQQQQQQQRQQQLNHYHHQQLLQQQQHQQHQQQQQLMHQQQLLQQQHQQLIKKPNQAVDVSHNSPYSSQRNSSLGANGEIMTNSSVSGIDQRTNIYGSINNFSNGDPSNVNANLSTYNGRVYKAMYDYEAQDDDEVSFRDGDVIVNVSNIRAGWMTGQVHRTGEVGMLPANYVELMRI